VNGAPARRFHPAAALRLQALPPQGGAECSDSAAAWMRLVSIEDSIAWSHARGKQAAGAQGSRTRAWGRAAEDAESLGAQTHRGSIIVSVLPFCGGRSRPPSEALQFRTVRVTVIFKGLRR
jgi:hypothetical protein